MISNESGEMRSSRVDAPLPGPQVIGESGLLHHLDLYDRLADRRRESAGYRAHLEEVLGFSLQEAVISTSEHAAPFNFASSVSYALPQWAIQRAGLRPPARIVITVATLVPFDNRHYPRGFVQDGAPRLNLFPNRVMKSCPMLQPPVDLEARVEIRKETVPFLAKYPWLRPLLTGSVPFQDAADQMCAVMEAMAAKWFPAAPNPVTVRSMEEVARRMLVRLIASRDPWLDRMLFDPSVRSLIAQRLMGTVCAWGAHHGSFLFWNRRGERLGRFVEEDRCLVDGDTRVPLTREAILNGLLTRSILPGVFLSLLVISYLPGLAVAGGPKQPDYYRVMIQAANEVGGLTRGEELSTYGYWCVDMSRLTPNRAATRQIPKDGAGLSLTDGTCDAEWLCEQLAQIPVLPIPPTVTYA